MCLYMAKGKGPENSVSADGYRSELEGVALPITEMARVAVNTAVRVALAPIEGFNWMREKVSTLIAKEPEKRVEEVEKVSEYRVQYLFHEREDSVQFLFRE